MSGRWALAVLGDPLAYTLSPVLHRAGLALLGLEGGSEAIRTPPDRLGERLADLAARGYRGASVTHPLKEPALAFVTRASGRSQRARSVNTIGFEPDGSWGDTTDGEGFVDWIGRLGRDPSREQVTMLGGGGAARSLALALAGAGATLDVSVRDPARARAAWADVPRARVVEWRSAAEEDALQSATVIVNATPLAGEEPPLPLERCPAHALLLDLTYGPEPGAWVRAARSRGIEAHDGLGLLVFQARRAFERWSGRPLAWEPFAAAVGWPR